MPDQVIQWASSDTTVATVGSDGMVRARTTGSITVTATSGRVSGRAQVTVTLRHTVSVPTVGGVVGVAGAGEVTVPAGTFAAPESVTVEVTRDPRVEAGYVATGWLYDAGPRVAYEVKVRIGTATPRQSMAIDVVVPPAFVALLGAEYRPVVFIGMLSDGGEEILDEFVPAAATFDVSTGRFRAVVPPEAFTHWRRADYNLEAIVVLGSAPVVRPNSVGTESAAGATNRQVHAQSATAPCTYPVLAAPLRTMIQTSPFGNGHKGIDLRAQEPLPVYASRKGVVERIAYNEQPLDKPDSRSGKLVKGWGRYVAVRHPDGTLAIYAHLTEGSTSHVTVGSTVAAGEQIALSGNTGGSERHHLHVEYRRPQDKQDIPFDPAPCLAVGIDIQPGSVSLDVGVTTTLALRVATINGGTLPTPAEATWNSGDAGVATVNAVGGVRAVAPGSTHVRAALGQMQTTASVTVTRAQPVLHTSVGSFGSAVNIMRTLTFDGIENGVPAPRNSEPFTFYSSASYGIVTVISPFGNSNVPGFLTISGLAANPGWQQEHMRNAPFGDALIPGLSYPGRGVLFTFADQTVTAVGAHFGTLLQEPTACCVAQSAIVTFWDGEVLDIGLNELRGGERSLNSFFGISASARPIKSILFNQVGHNPGLDNFMYGHAH
jgi:murein DD-endopeptidase MepM/ murein hydrolase activator NlpD